MKPILLVPPVEASVPAEAVVSAGAGVVAAEVAAGAATVVEPLLESEPQAVATTARVTHTNNGANRVLRFMLSLLVVGACPQTGGLGGDVLFLA